MKHHSLNDVWGSIAKELENNKQAKILVVHCGVWYLQLAVAGGGSLGGFGALVASRFDGAKPLPRILGP